MVLEVAGRLSDVVDEVDRAIQLALATGPRGVVCDLTKTLAEGQADAVETWWLPRGAMSRTGPGYRWPWRAQTRHVGRLCVRIRWAGT
jgi:hypothetical protein